MDQSNRSVVEQMLRNHEAKAFNKKPVGDVRTMKPVKNPVYVNTELRTREQVYDEYVDILNVLKVDHYYDMSWPITRSQLETSYCTKSGSYLAKSGPRRGMYRAFLAIDKYHVCRMSPERYYVIMAHEATHVENLSHSPEFWRRMAQNCAKLYNSGLIDVDLGKYLYHVRNDPNSSMTDQRTYTVEEQRRAVEQEFMNYLR